MIKLNKPEKYCPKEGAVYEKMVSFVANSEKDPFYYRNGKPIKYQIQDPRVRRRIKNYWKIIHGIPYDEEQYIPSHSRVWIYLERVKNMLLHPGDLIIFILAIYGAACLLAYLLFRVK